MNANRQIESKRNQKELQERFSPNKEETRQMLLIGMLADIADSLSLLCDLYALANNLTMETKKLGEEDADRS